jgi:oligopeptide/dipeptide ABC transporter ATP-binding protein
MGMVPATSGSVIYGGRDISALKPSGPELKKLRGEMQIVFQNPRSSFNPRLHLKQQLTSVAAFYGLGPQEARRRIAELFELTGLSDDILLHRSDELSGGQLQRLAIVRALIPSPSFLMADEAVSALDVSVRAQILELFRDMQERLGLTVFFVSHDLTVVEYIADRVLVLYLGSILESAPAEELFARPAHPYTKSLLAAKPRAYPDEEKRYEPLEGEIGDASDLPPGCRFCPRCRESIPGLCDKEPPPEAEPAPGHIVSCHLYAGQGAP